MVFGGTSVGANGGPADSCGGCNEMDSHSQKSNVKKTVLVATLVRIVGTA